MAEDISTDLANVDELGIDSAKAVDAVKMSNAKGINPVDAYDNLETFQAADKVVKPVLAPPGVTEYAQRSPAHAAVIKQDQQKLSTIERIFGGSFAAASSIPKQAESNRLTFELMIRKHGKNSTLQSLTENSLNLSDEQLAGKIVELNDELDAIPDYSDDADSAFSPAKIIPGLVGVGTQIIDSTLQHAGKVGAAAGTGAAVGGAIGFTAGGVGAIPGAIAGAQTAGFMAMNAAVTYDTFKQTAGDIYQFTMNANDKSIPDEEAYNLALAGGAVSGAIEGVLLGSLGKIAKWGSAKAGSTFTKKGFFNLIKTNPVARQYMLDLGKRVAGGALGEVSQELVKIYSENLATNKTLNPFTIFSENAERLLDNGIIGAAVPISVGAVTARKNIRQAKAQPAAKTSTKAPVEAPQVAVEGIPAVNNTPINESGVNEAQLDQAVPDVVDDSITLFRGVEKGREVLDNSKTVGNALFFTDKEELVKQYVGDGGSKVSGKAKLGKVIDGDNWYKVQQKLGFEKPGTMEEMINEARKQGYDTVTFKNKGEKEYIVLNPENFKSDQSGNPPELNADEMIDEDVSTGTAVELNERDSKKMQRQQQFMEQFDEVSAALEDTRLKKDPEMQADVLNAISKDSQAFVDAQSIRDMGEAQIEAFEKQTGVKLSDTDKETILIPYSKAVQLAQQDPLFKGVIRGEADGYSLNDMDELQNQIKNNADRIDSVTQALGVETLPEEERAKLVAELRELTHPENVALDPESYVNDDAIPATMREVLPEGETESLNKTVKDIRTKIVEAANESKRAEIDTLIDLETETQMVLEKERIEQQLREDTTSDTVRKFEDGGSVDSGTLVRLRMMGFNPESIKDNHTRDGFSLLAIDPKSLPPELKHFAKDPQLKAMGVFVGGGIPLQVASDALGKFKTPKELLIHLSQNQTIEQKRQRLGELTEREVRTRKESEIGITERDHLDAYQELANINLKEINTILKEKTGEAKKLIKRLGKIVSTNDTLKQKAAKIVSNLKVSEMNADMYRRNANYARARAATALTKGDWQNFVEFKEKEALNNMLIKEVSQKNRTLNNNIKKIARMNTNESAQAIRNMTPEVQQTINEMMGMIEYNPRRKAVDRLNYVKSVEALSANGDVDISMDPQFLDNGKTYINDMPFDQANAITKFVVDAFYINRDINQMKKVGTEAQNNQRIKEVADGLSERLVAKAGFNSKLAQDFKEGRIELDEKGKVKRNRIMKVFAKFNSATDIFSFLIKKLDDNLFAGEFAKAIYNPLDEGIVGDRKFMNSHDVQTKLQAETYGKDFRDINNTEFDVEELSHTRFKGKVSKVQFLNMLAYMGTESSIKRMEADLGMKRDAITEMLGKYLDQRDFELVQKKIDFYETSVKEKNTEMLKASLGDMPKYIDAVPITFVKGGLIGKKMITFKGGYFPLTYDNPINKQLERRVKDQAQIQREIQVKQKAESMTENGRNKERADNVDRPLSYEFFVNDRLAVADFSRDIHLRIPLRNVSKIFGDQDFMANLVGNIGVDSADEMTSSLVHLAGNDDSSAIKLDREIQDILAAHRNKFSLYALAYNAGTVMKQFASLPVVYGNLQNNTRDKKLKTFITYASTMAQFVHSPKQSIEAVKAIADMDPEMFDKLKQWNSGLNPIDSMKSLVGRVVDAPNIYADTSQNPESRNKFQKVRNGVNSVATWGMKGLAGAAIALNASAYIAAYKSAMAGDVKNVNADHKQAMQYARTMVQMSLESNSPLDTAAVFKAKGFLSTFTNFFRQPLIQFKNVQSSFGEAVQGVRENQTWAQHTESGARLASQMLWYAVLPNLLLRGVDQARGRNDGEDEDKNMVEKLAGAVFSWQTVLSPLDNALLVKDITYGIENDRKVLTNPVLDTWNAGYKNIKNLVDITMNGKAITTGMVRDAIKAGSIGMGLPNTIMKQITADSVKNAKSIDSGINLDGADDVGILDYAASIPDQVMELLTGSYGRNDAAADLTYAKGTPEYEALAQEQKDAIDLINMQVETVTFRTNPEMDKITAHNGTVELNPQQVEEYKIFMQGISNLETMNQVHFGNATSTAAGYFHIIDSTWNDIVSHYPDLGLPADVREATRDQQYQAMWRAMGEYTNDIQESGNEVNGVNLYLRHMMGPGAYRRFTNAPDDASADVFMSEAAQRQNPGIVGATKARTLRNTARLLEPYLTRAVETLEAEQAPPPN